MAGLWWCWQKPASRFYPKPVWDSSFSSCFIISLRYKYFFATLLNCNYQNKLVLPGFWTKIWTKRKINLCALSPWIKVTQTLHISVKVSTKALSLHATPVSFLTSTIWIIYTALF
jgi:hypothetical protein